MTERSSLPSTICAFTLLITLPSFFPNALLTTARAEHYPDDYVSIAPEMSSKKGEVPLKESILRKNLTKECKKYFDDLANSSKESPKCSKHSDCSAFCTAFDGWTAVIPGDLEEIMFREEDFISLCLGKVRDEIVPQICQRKYKYFARCESGSCSLIVGEKQVTVKFEERKYIEALATKAIERSVRLSTESK